MNDRELMELAAMAAGYSVRTDLTYEAGIVINDGVIWNPLTNDGDALRLAVKLGMRILADPGIDGCVVVQIYPPTSPLKSVWTDELAEPDPLAATRRAIVRAAAEIGKKMK